MGWLQNLTNKARGVVSQPKTDTPSVKGNGNGTGCDHSEINLRQGTAEFEWFIAKAELETKSNLPHGACHLSNLLTYDPRNPEWVALLEGYLAAAGPGADEKLIPREEKLYYGTEAMRAYVWHKQGRLQEATELLINVFENKPDVRYPEAWLLPWLEAPGAVESLEPMMAMRLFSGILDRFQEYKYLTVPRTKDLRRWAKLSDRVDWSPLAAARSPVAMCRAGLHRKAGLFDEAIALIKNAMAQASDQYLWLALGLALREKGDPVEAEKAFKAAIKLDPTNVGARLDAGDMCFNLKQWKAALAWYEDAMKIEKYHPWAEPSAMYCRWKLTGDDQHIFIVGEMVKLKNQRARMLIAMGFSRLRFPCDAGANTLSQIRDKVAAGALRKEGEVIIKLTLNQLEAPSNYLAYRLEFDAAQTKLELQLNVANVTTPDPRQPIGPVKYLLWKYEGTKAIPAIAPPSETVQKAIAQLASRPYDEHTNWAAASRLAAKIGPARVGEVLATMVHPPALPAGKTALEWMTFVQEAAAQVAAQVDTGWQGSARREALVSLLWGPMDWTTSCAIRALAKIGRDEEALAPDIHDLFQKLLEHQPKEGYICWLYPLFESWGDLPHLFPQEREALAAKCREIESWDEQSRQ